MQSESSWFYFVGQIILLESSLKSVIVLKKLKRTVAILLLKGYFNYIILLNLPQWFLFKREFLSSMYDHSRWKAVSKMCPVIVFSGLCSLPLWVLNFEVVILLKSNWQNFLIPRFSPKSAFFSLKSTISLSSLSISYKILLEMECSCVDPSWGATAESHLEAGIPLYWWILPSLRWWPTWWNGRLLGRAGLLMKLRWALQIFSGICPPSVSIFLAKGRQAIVLSLRPKRFQLCLEVQRTRFG